MLRWCPGGGRLRGNGTAGERDDALAALERIRARLAGVQQCDPAIEMLFSMPEQWSRRPFVALCRRHGLSPYRCRRQRLTTYLNDMTLRVIREEIHADANEAAEVADAMSPCNAGRRPKT